jgi:actin-related protein
MDIGTHSLKVGHADTNKELIPQHVIPSMVGFPKLIKMSTAHTKTDMLAGLDCIKRAHLLALKFPIEHGIVMDWDEMSLLLDHSFKQMGVDPKTLEGGLMTNEAALNPKKNREKMMEIMFEHFEVPKYFV